MGEVSDQFYGMRAELARSVAANDRAITLVIGAGASLSSGAPTTPAVQSRLEDATKTRLGSLVRERLHEIVSAEVRDQLTPLFDDVCPNVGYRLLAAMGHRRRIQVINLNWDDALEQACERSGVHFATFDPLGEETLAQAAEKLDEGTGVLIVHVHGTLEHRPRYSLLETLPSHQVWDAVQPLLRDTTIICGTSLAGDLDVAETIHAATGSVDEGPAVWMFARPSSVNEKPLVDLPPRWTRVYSHDVDFDGLVSSLAEETWAAHGLTDARWKDLAQRLAYLDLPDIDGLVEVNADTRRGLLEAYVVALVARPLAGKTVGALRLAHLRMLMQAPNANLVVTADLQDSATTAALTAELAGTVAFIDDPFGQIRPADNPRVVDFLEAIADTGESWAYVSSRDANWNRHAASLLRDYPGLAVPTRHPERWYEYKDLQRLAGRTLRDARARRAIDAKKATTPPEVLEAGRVGRVRSQHERVSDAAELLDADHQLALACVLVRMQELRMAPISDAEFGAILGSAPSALDGVEALLYNYRLDGQSCWAFVHPTIRQVTDDYLFVHHAELTSALLDAPVVPSWLPRALDAWRLQHGLASRTETGIGVEAPTPGDWIAERLSTAPTNGLLQDISLEVLDQWELIELAYALVWVWDSVSSLPAAEILLDDLLRQPMGCYAVLEGCLYFQLGADDELWTRVASRLWKLSRDANAETELILVLDAVLWREPSNEAVAQWASRAFDSLDRRTAQFGFVRFAAGYHPDGLVALESQRVLTGDARLEWSHEQALTAANLVAWHFAHQSRARAMLHRYSHHDKQWLCQSTFDGAPLDSPDAILGLAESLVAFEDTAGWGFHLLCNLAAVAGLDLQEERTRALATEALERAPRGDPGVISAVLAYEPTDVFRRHLAARIQQLDELEFYLDALSFGVTAGIELTIAPPGFRLIHDSAAVLETIGADFPSLSPEFRQVPPSSLAENLWHAAPGAMADSSLAQRAEVARRIGRVERGDLRPLAIAARGARGSDPYAQVLNIWRGEIPSGEDETLF